MTAVWITVAALAATSALTRASGPLIMAGRKLHPRVVGVVDLLAPALLTALIVTQTLDGGGAVDVDAALGGVAAAGGLLASRRDALLPAIVLAAVVTAAIRAL